VKVIERVWKMDLLRSVGWWAEDSVSVRIQAFRLDEYTVSNFPWYVPTV